MIPTCHGIPGKVMVFANAAFHVLEFCEVIESFGKVMDFDLPTMFVVVPYVIGRLQVAPGVTFKQIL